MFLANYKNSFIILTNTAALNLTYKSKLSKSNSNISLDNSNSLIFLEDFSNLDFNLDEFKFFYINIINKVLRA